jgi:DNA-binding NarL/FixJ family response regulator
MANEVKILVVDDHTLFRSGLVTILETQSCFQVVGEAGNGPEAIRQAKELQPDIVLMDITMPDCSGIDLTRELREEVPSAKVIMLTVSERDEDLLEAIQAGAKGYVLKTAKPKELLSSISLAVAGESLVLPAIGRRLLTELAQLSEVRSSEREAQIGRGTGNGLTEREKEVLRLIGRGASNKEMAETLCIAENTVKSHLHHILDKLKLRNRSEAAVYAHTEGLD